MTKLTLAIILVLMSIVIGHTSPDTTIVNYYEDGTVMREITYTNNVPTGLSRFYYKSGSIYDITNYGDGTFVRREVFNEDGSVAFISYIKDGKCIEEDSTGNIIYIDVITKHRQCVAVGLLYRCAGESDKRSIRKSVTDIFGIAIFYP